MDRQPVTITLIDESDTEEVLAFLREHFFKDEPLNASLDLGVCKELEYFCSKSIKDRLSFKASDANGNCVGVCISGQSATTGDPSVTSEVEDSIYKRHEKFYRIIKLTEELDRKVDLQRRFPHLRDYVEGKVLSVDEKYRGKGIARQLIERTLQEMQRRKLPMMVIQCSGSFSAKVMQRLDFELVAKIPYKDFLLDGKRALTPKWPHEEMTAFIKWVA